MEIKNSTLEDIDAIFALYDQATAYQKTVFHKNWEGFDRAMVTTEINENRQWKIVINGQIACIFALTFNDVLFWKEKDAQPSIYIHRIVTDSAFRGVGFVNKILDWAKIYCRNNGKDYIRMDTWGDNPKLIDYYVRCGFNYVGTIDLDNTEGLPIHYKGTLALFEIKIDK
jgi:ribosomal protein S18 acetylase RimI-like enzyme